eukprot:scaffold1883_cov396-Prasinococcus_capsulatus_cf.AAC.22
MPRTCCMALARCTRPRAPHPTNAAAVEVRRAGLADASLVPYRPSMGHARGRGRGRRRLEQVTAPQARLHPRRSRARLTPSG